MTTPTNSTIRVSEKAERVLHASALLRGCQISDLIEDYANFMLRTRFSRVLDREGALVPADPGPKDGAPGKRSLREGRKPNKPIAWNCPYCNKRLSRKESLVPHFANCAQASGDSKSVIVSKALADGWLLKASGAVFLKRNSAERKRHMTKAIELAR